jgi:hypothetical protein
LDGGGNLVNDFRTPRFGEIGDTFDELGHETSISGLGLMRAIIRREEKRGKLNNCNVIGN